MITKTFFSFPPMSLMGVMEGLLPLLGYYGCLCPRAGCYVARANWSSVAGWGSEKEEIWLNEKLWLLVALWSGSHRRLGISRLLGVKRVCEKVWGGGLLWDPGTTGRSRVEEAFQGMWLVMMVWAACLSTMCLCERRDDRPREGKRHGLGEAGGWKRQGSKDKLQIYE